MSDGQPAYDHDDMVLGWAVDSLVAATDSFALAQAGSVADWADAHAADARHPCVFLNNVTLRVPLAPEGVAGLVERLDGHFGTGDRPPWLLWSPWPTPDLRTLGFTLVGHPPVMYRPAGPAPPTGARPPGLEIVEATDEPTMADAERVVVEGYPLSVPPGSPAVVNPALRAGRFHTWVGYVDGHPVATASTQLTDDVNLVEMVAVLPDHRGRGYGEALTWAATRANPDRPGLLESSDLGRPVYARMGYVAISRMTLWMRTPA